MVRTSLKGKQMPNFKDTQNNLHHLDDAQYIYLLPEGSLEITDEEAEAMRLAAIPVPTVAELKVAKQYEIDVLEASQFMTRGERESWLTMIEAQATAQDISLETLYLANPFYKKLKDIDNKIIILRNELIAIV